VFQKVAFTYKCGGWLFHEVADDLAAGTEGKLCIGNGQLRLS
jgi:hypothetical protein